MAKSVIFCPKCKINMNSLSYKGVTIEKCPGCGGVWIDEGEESFVTEILRRAGNESCADCTHLGEKRLCKNLKIYVSNDFHCSRFIRK